MEQIKTDLKDIKGDSDQDTEQTKPNTKSDLSKIKTDTWTPSPRYNLQNRHMTEPKLKPDSEQTQTEEPDDSEWDTMTQ